MHRCPRGYKTSRVQAVEQGSACLPARDGESAGEDGGGGGGGQGDEGPGVQRVRKNLLQKHQVKVGEQKRKLFIVREGRQALETTTKIVTAIVS